MISVSSLAHRLGGIHFDDPNYLKHKYDKFDAYAQAKTANALFAIGLDERAKKYGVRSYAVHPGCVPTTNLTRDLPIEERVARPVIGQDGKPVADDYPQRNGVRRWAVDTRNAD